MEYQSSSEIKAGDIIVSALTRYGGTVGFCATRNGKEGIFSKYYEIANELGIEAITF